MSDDLASLLALKFIQQRDVKAWQQPNGSYLPDRSKLVKSDILAHLSGNKTLGHYVVAADNTTRIIAFDIDVVDTLTRDYGSLKLRDEFANPESIWYYALRKDINNVARALASRMHDLLKIPVAAAFSGSKGLHVYGFPDPWTAAESRSAAKFVLDSFSGVFSPTKGDNFYTQKSVDTFSIEIFPKQDTLEEGAIGNLLRLPLGINRKSGKNGYFVHFYGDMTEFAEMEPLVALDGHTLPWPKKP